MFDVSDIGAGVLNYAWVAAGFIGVVLVACVGALILYKMKRGEWFGKFPVKVRIWNYRAGSVHFVGSDSLRSVEDDGGSWLSELKKRKTKFQSIPFDLLNPDDSVDLLEINRDEYHPFKLVCEDAEYMDSKGVTKKIPIPKLRPILNEEWKHVYKARVKKNFERRPEENWFTKYGGVISILLVGMMVLLILAIVLKQFDPIISTAASAAHALAEASQVWANTCGGVPVGGAP